MSQQPQSNVGNKTIICLNNGEFDSSSMDSGNITVPSNDNTPSQTLHSNNPSVQKDPPSLDLLAGLCENANPTLPPDSIQFPSSNLVGSFDEDTATVEEFKEYFQSTGLLAVEITSAQTNPVKKIPKRISKHKYSPNKLLMSRLKSINNVPVWKIPLDAIRPFRSKFRTYLKSINKPVSKNKKDICDDLVDLRIKFDEGEITLDDDGLIIMKNDSKPEFRRENRINIKRFINVLFSATIRPILATRDMPLTKDQLTIGSKRDEIMHREIIKEYNNPEFYNEDEWPTLGSLTSARLEEKPIVWQTSKKYLQILGEEYEVAYHNYRRTGNHGDFGDSDGDANFGSFIKSNQSLLYIHEFFHLYPEILATITGQLPKRVKLDTMDTNSERYQPKKKLKTKAKTTMYDKAVNVFLEQQEYRNKKLGQKFELHSYLQMNSVIMRLYKENDELWEFVKKKTKKTRLQLKDKYSLMKQRHAENIYDSDDNDSVDNIFEQIINHKEQIKLLKKKGANIFNLEE